MKAKKDDATLEISTAVGGMHAWMSRENAVKTSSMVDQPIPCQKSYPIHAISFWEPSQAQVKPTTEPLTLTALFSFHMKICKKSELRRDATQKDPDGKQEAYCHGHPESREWVNMLQASKMA